MARVGFRKSEYPEMTTTARSHALRGNACRDALRRGPQSIPTQNSKRRRGRFPFSLSFPRSAWECLPRRSCVADPKASRHRTRNGGEEDFPSPHRPHLQHPRLPGIIPGTGITPVDRVLDVAAFHRVVVNVLQLLPHHLLTLDQL